jgi:hypothetical protein
MDTKHAKGGKAQLEVENARWRRLTGAVGLMRRMTAAGAE